MLYKVISIVIVAVVSLVGFSQAKANDKEEANMAVMKRFYSEVANKGNFALIDELLAKNFVEHEILPGEQQNNREGVKQFFQSFRKAFPDASYTVDFMFAKDDKVVVYLTISGTQKGEFMGMPASGKKMNMKAIDIVRFVDGKAVEHWGITDSMAMMQQLGAFPERLSAK
jgi:steroid delta-isomerase-like uncharacterized protein